MRVVIWTVSGGVGLGLGKVVAKPPVSGSTAKCSLLGQAATDADRYQNCCRIASLEKTSVINGNRHFYKPS